MATIDDSVGEEFVYGPAPCYSCGTMTDTECDLCGSPICCDDCGGDERHTICCGVLQDNDVVGISLNETEVLNVREYGREFLLSDDEKSVVTDTGVLVSMAGAEAIRSLLHGGVRVFFVPAGQTFVSRKQGPARRTGFTNRLKGLKADAQVKYEQARRALRTKAEAFAYHDVNRISGEGYSIWPAVVVFGHRPRHAAVGWDATNGPWADAYVESIAYLAGRGVSDMLYRSAIKAQQKANSHHHKLWLKDDTKGHRTIGSIASPPTTIQPFPKPEEVRGRAPPYPPRNTSPALGLPPPPQPTSAAAAAKPTQTATAAAKAAAGVVPPAPTPTPAPAPAPAPTPAPATATAKSVTPASPLAKSAHL
jgi:hypothetical protein